MGNTSDPIGQIFCETEVEFKKIFGFIEGPLFDEEVTARTDKIDHRRNQVNLRPGGHRQGAKEIENKPGKKDD